MGIRPRLPAPRTPPMSSMTCKDSQDADFAQHRIHLQGTEFGTDKTVFVTEHQDNDLHSVAANEEEFLMELKEQDHIKSHRFAMLCTKIQSTIAHAKACGLFSNNVKFDSPSDLFFREGIHVKELPAILISDTALEIEWRAAYDERKLNFKQSLKECNTSIESKMADVSLNLLQTSAYVSNISDMTPSLECVPIQAWIEGNGTSLSSSPDCNIINSFIAEFTLNKEQALAFSIVADHSMHVRKKPLTISLIGARETEKSQLITSP